MKPVNSSFDKRVVHVDETIRVVENETTGQRSLYAGTAFKKHEVISSFEAEEELSSPTYLTLQKDENLHITLSPAFLQYVNHSCSPTAFFDTTAMQFIALKDIQEGEELTFFYPSAEWQMAQAFACHCGSKNCLSAIQGAAFLPEDVLKRYRLTDFIRGKLQEKKEKEKESKAA